MARTIEARAVISARDRTGSVFSQIAGKMRQVERGAQRISHQQSRLAATGVATVGGMRALGAAAAAYVGVGAVAQAARRFGDFDERLRRFQNTAEVTSDQLGVLESKVRMAARAYGMSREDVFAGPEKLLAGGMAFDEAIARTDTIARVAKAYGASADQIADATLSLGQNLKIGSADLPKAFEHIAVSTKLGQIEFNAFAKWLPSLTGRMQALGVVGMQAVDTIGAMAQAARKTAGSDDEALNNVVNFLDKLSAPDTRKNLKKMGFDLQKTFEQSRKSGKDFVQVMIDELDRLTKGDLFKASDIFGDKQARDAMLAVVQNLKEMRANLGAMRNSAGVVDRDLANIMAGPKAKVEQFKTSIDEATSAFLRLGANAAPAVDAATRVLDRLNRKLYGPGDAEREVGAGHIVMPGREVAPSRREFAPGSGGFRSRGGPRPATAEDLTRGYDRDMARARAAERMFVGSTGSWDTDWNFGALRDARDHFQDLKGAARREAAKRGGMSIYDARARLDEIDRSLEGEKLRPNVPGFANSDERIRALAAKRVEAEVGKLVRERLQIQNAIEGRGAPTAEEIAAAVRSVLDGITAEVKQPVDVTGKVQLDPASRAEVRVTVDVRGDGRVTGMSASSSGHIRANVGTTMAHAASAGMGYNSIPRSLGTGGE